MAVAASRRKMSKLGKLMRLMFNSADMWASEIIIEINPRNMLPMYSFLDFFIFNLL
jgi:hypothetical protein